MPIFQPGGTNAGYRGPAKTLTIKALQDRQKALQASQDAAVSNAPPIVNMWQGAGALANSLGDSMQMSRAASQESDARAQLAGIMTQIDPSKGASMEQIAAMQQLDPEFANAEYARAMSERAKIADREDTQTFQAGESEADRQARIAEQQAGFTHDDTTAATKVRTDKDAATYADSLADENANDAAGRAAKKARLDAALATTEAQRAAAVADGSMPAAEADRLNTLDREKLETEIAGGQATTAATVASIGTPPTPEDIKAWPILQDPANAAKYAMVDGKPELIDPVQKPADFMSPGEIKTDQDAATEINEWKTTGGPNAIKAMTQVNKALDLLRNNNITGFRQGIIDKTLPSYLSALYNPDGTIAKSAIRETIAQTLRETLGAQFTQQEGENLMERAFDSSLDESENIRRAQLLLDQVNQIAINKQSRAEWWDKHQSSMRGYTGAVGGPDVMQTLRDLAEGKAAAPAPETGGGGGAGGGSPDVDAIIKRAKGGG
jgi:hypothetical protein